jgi:hypothetical protein
MVPLQLWSDVLIYHPAQTLVEQLVREVESEIFSQIRQELPRFHPCVGDARVINFTMESPPPVVPIPTSNPQRQLNRDIAPLPSPVTRKPPPKIIPEMILGGPYNYSWTHGRMRDS